MNKYFLLSLILIFIGSVNAVDQYSIIYNIPIGPNITSWNNNKTNDNSLIFQLNVNELVKFNISANQPVDTWNWYKDGIIQNNNYDNFTASWTNYGNKVISVNGTNINGMTETIIWTITVLNKINISSCGNLNQANTIYYLNSNISSTGTCLTIGANNITLEGQGKTINYSTTRIGYGIVDTGGYDNIIIRNLTLKQQNSAYSYSHGIYFKNVVDSRAENINVITIGSSSDGIYLSSSGSNTLSNFNISTTGTSAYGIYTTLSNSNLFSGFDIKTSGNNGHGIYISSSNYNNFSNMVILASGNGIRINSANSNTIKDGSIISSLINDYYLQNSGTTNNFNNTNFTTRKVYLNDNISKFNYGNNGIWLNTNQIVSPTKTLTITRKLASWNQTNVSWQETVSASRILNYEMAGLLANTNYIIWNGTINFNLTTDINGNLPAFSINLTTSAKLIKVLSS
jgi:hypothetical protein